MENFKREDVQGYLSPFCKDGMLDYDYERNVNKYLDQQSLERIKKNPKYLTLIKILNEHLVQEKSEENSIGIKR